MEQKRRKKHAMTLLEIMIVIFLIGLIGSVVGYNVQGSLEAGKAFRSEKGKEKIEDILSMEVPCDMTTATLRLEAKNYLEASHLCKDTDALLLDGWGQPYVLEMVGGKVQVTSNKLEEYRKKKEEKKSTTK